jgi:hypothetical protein
VRFSASNLAQNFGQIDAIGQWRISLLEQDDASSFSFAALDRHRD